LLIVLVSVLSRRPEEGLRLPGGAGPGALGDQEGGRGRDGVPPDELATGLDWLGLAWTDLDGLGWTSHHEQRPAARIEQSKAACSIGQLKCIEYFVLMEILSSTVE
jgi:hypothetical protein